MAVGSSASSAGGGVASPGSMPERRLTRHRARQRSVTPSPTPCWPWRRRIPRIVALTAAMPGPTGLLSFQARFPERYFDVGIAEQHEVTSAAGMAMAGLRPVVAVYSTFFCRAFDQANLDVGLHGCPVVYMLDRAGITGDDGPSHHGVLDLALRPVDSRHDGVRAVGGGGDRADDACHARRCRARRRFATPKAWRATSTRRRPGMGSRRSGCAKVTARCVCSASASSSGRASRGGRTVGRGDRGHGLGHPGRVAAGSGDGGRRGPAHAGGDGRGRGAARRGRCVPPHAVDAQAESAGLLSPATRRLGIPRQYIAQGRRDVLLASASTGPVSPIACGAPG